VDQFAFHGDTVDSTVVSPATVDFELEVVGRGPVHVVRFDLHAALVVGDFCGRIARVSLCWG
jgi:hypothetical protein